MFTPKQLDEITFSKELFGGYNMQSVDEFLEPFTEDYITLYKENALLKSKMRVLVGKLEEYRKNEASMKEAVVNAQKTCDKMVMEAEAKCNKMLSEASAAAAAKTAVAAPAAPASSFSAADTDALVAAENARVENARQAASAKIAELQDQLQTCIQALERIKSANAPAAPVAPAAPAAAPAPMAAPAPKAAPAEDVADQIAQSVEAIVGTTVDHAPKAAPKHPTANESTTSKFASLNLQFGRNYDPKSR